MRQRSGHFRGRRIRQRGGARLVADVLGTDEANARMRDRDRLARELAASIVVPWDRVPVGTENGSTSVRA
ncbi:MULTISPECIES: hypothetical protein [unclassified Streptomyces]|uniref:hypothetical protein n=1 Tax=unclassified Streptomyces TaxID=2593676 RepID=UPI00364F36C7